MVVCFEYAANAGLANAELNARPGSGRVGDVFLSIPRRHFPGADIDERRGAAAKRAHHHGG